MLTVECALGIIMVLGLTTGLALWESSIRRQRLFIDALLLQVAGHRGENQRQMQWVREERARLKKEDDPDWTANTLLVGSRAPGADGLLATHQAEV